MRKMTGFLFAVVLIAIGIWSTNMSSPKTKTGLFKDIRKYPEIVYSAESGCRDLNGERPPTTINGDFDGDGTIDRARIAQKDPTHQVLVVWLSTKDNIPMELDAVEEPDRMSVGLAKSSEVIQSTCERGYDETCKDGETREVKLEREGIWYLLCESAASVFYWNPTKGAFDRTWYND